MISIILYPISIIPVILIYFWIKKKVFRDDEHRIMAKNALISGLKSVIPAVIIGALFLIIQRVAFKDESMAKTFFYTFFALALPEELSKAFMFERLLKKQDKSFSWLDFIICMVIVAIGFDILESAIYAVGASPMEIILRGVTCPHLGFGFIMGYFIGKAKKKGNRLLYIPAFLIPWIIHGSYDFCIEFDAGDTDYVIMFSAIALAALSLVLTISFVFFTIKARNNTKYSNTFISVS
ncbi:MAG: PrsW family intramembrane metalloprotease [Butyrivibrio sp.]|uniref:PrsW family glutamic-type intramembrane protease n=1 Tax=Butyrivibrio sp. TaxID=28121 RepID=UPI001B2C4980|nr:PrsW family glutamic-type intramembrane protease [Butyrivibrio sp.]MBO6242673.1 PrsW family intramembrane metalloprotease [Butyrivibrio sp.]